MRRAMHHRRAEETRVTGGASERGGVYHVVATGGGATWCEFASKIFELAGVEVDITPTTQAAWGAAAPRPAYSVLDNTSLRLMGHEQALMPSWDEQLEAFFSRHGQALRDEFVSP